MVLAGRGCRSSFRCAPLGRHCLGVAAQSCDMSSHAPTRSPAAAAWCRNGLAAGRADHRGGEVESSCHWLFMLHRRTEFVDTSLGVTVIAVSPSEKAPAFFAPYETVY